MNRKLIDLSKVLFVGSLLAFLFTGDVIAQTSDMKIGFGVDGYKTFMREKHNSFKYNIPVNYNVGLSGVARFPVRENVEGLVGLGIQRMKFGNSSRTDGKTETVSIFIPLKLRIQKPIPDHDLYAGLQLGVTPHILVFSETNVDKSALIDSRDYWNTIRGDFQYSIYLGVPVSNSELEIHLSAGASFTNFYNQNKEVNGVLVHENRTAYLNYYGLGIYFYPAFNSKS